jgi:Phosphotransferase enzyme family
VDVDREPPMLAAVEPEVVEVARRVVHDTAAELLDWSATPIAHLGIIDTTGGLHRVDGRVRSRGAELEWSCVLKLLKRPPLVECLGPRSWCYWLREAAFYASSVPSSLPGPMRAPRAYGVSEHDDEAHIWMEYIAVPSGRWRHEDFRRAAHAAGLSAGEFLRERAVPDEPWLVRGFLRSLLADGGFWATRMAVESSGAWRSPLAESFGAKTRERVLRIWADRDALLSSIDALPQVFGHGDFHPRNLLLRSDVDEIVALDWAFCGPSPLGADLADLVSVAAWFCDIEMADFPAIEQAAFAGYEEGLRTAGCDCDARLVRLGYATAIALRLGACMPGWAAEMLGPEEAPSSERLYGRPAESILATWIALEDICLDLADEARELAAQTGLSQGT